MPVEKLSTTTLSEALDKNKNDFIVASTANISVGDYLVCRAEAMKVQDIPVSGRVRVARAVGGTVSREHKNGQRFFIGSPEKFQAIRESLTSLVGDSGTYPEFLLPGQRAKDGDGNEYVLLAPAITMYPGTTAVISRDGLYNCTIATGGVQGSVAVLVEGSTTDQYVWGQIYGYNSYCQEATGTSGITSAYFPVAQTSVTTPVVGMAAVGTLSETGLYTIRGMFITGVATSTVTSATSSTGIAVPVWLNYPYIALYGQITKTTVGA